MCVFTIPDHKPSHPVSKNTVTLSDSVTALSTTVSKAAQGLRGRWLQLNEIFVKTRLEASPDDEPRSEEQC